MHCSPVARAVRRDHDVAAGGDHRERLARSRKKYRRAVEFRRREHHVESDVSDRSPRDSRRPREPDGSIAVRIDCELLRRLEESARIAGAHVIWMHVAETNTPAIRLYEAHGYSQQGREENYYAKGIAALLYAKPVE